MLIVDCIIYRVSHINRSILGIRHIIDQIITRSSLTGLNKRILRMTGAKRHGKKKDRIDQTYFQGWDFYATAGSASTGCACGADVVLLSLSSLIECDLYLPEIAPSIYVLKR